MADGISFDFSELDRLAADLGDAPGNAGPFINSAAQFTAKNVRRDAARAVGQRKHFKQAAAGIDYDVTADGHKIEVEIGYNKAGKHADNAKLGNLVEYGSPGNPATNLPALSPGNELADALRNNEDDFVKGLNKAVDDAMKASNL